MKVIFMGTPDFAVGTLEEIIKAGHEVTLVITQPDKAKGRSGALQYPPVKECALAHNIPVFQPDRIRKPENIAEMKKYPADIIVVAAFGQILPQEVLDYPKHCCINVHASLLPKYRGAAPIQWAVLNGDSETGVTIQRMDVGLDTGDIITYDKVTLAEDETGGSLFDKLAVCGAKLCVKTMEMIENNTATYTKQVEEEATHVGMISKEMGEIDFSRSAVEIERQVRGLNPWPSAYTKLDHKTFKLWKVRVASDNELPEEAASFEKAVPGMVLGTKKGELFVQTGQGVLAIAEAQIEGKKRMDMASFLNGYPVAAGTQLMKI